MSNKLAKKYAIIRYDTKEKIWKPANLENIFWDSDHPQSIYKSEFLAKQAIKDYINKRYPKGIFSEETRCDYYNLYDIMEQ